jgi:hypothetical protein
MKIQVKITSEIYQKAYLINTPLHSAKFTDTTVHIDLFGKYADYITNLAQNNDLSKSKTVLHILDSIEVNKSLRMEILNIASKYKRSSSSGYSKKLILESMIICYIDNN